MTLIVEENNCLDAWRAVALALCSPASPNTALVRIRRPTYLENNWLREYCPKRIAPNAQSLTNVIGTVFPYRMVQRADSREALYNRYQAVQRRLGGRRPSSWGTYFGRLTAYGNTRANQLEDIISKINAWSRYEAAITLHITDPSLDGLRTRGAPCWQYGQVLWRPNDVLDLTVVYRNHDYFYKAFGNFIALGQLLAFIAAHTEKTPGELLCLSAHTYLSVPKRRLATLARI